jgi:endonuclease YncB( thermonuclease family)
MSTNLQSLRVAALLIAVLLLAMSPARAGEVPGPVMAEIVRVIDGDTFVVDAHVWPGHRVRVSVRLRGIDAPEIRTRCAAEKEAGLKARDALERMIGSGPVAISNIGGGKFYGRVLADARTQHGEDIGLRLLEMGLARPYDGGRREQYCASNKPENSVSISEY